MGPIGLLSHKQRKFRGPMKIATLFSILGLISSFGALSAEVVHTTLPSCDPTILTKFFPAPLVSETLDAYNVALYNHQLIVKDLSNRDQDVIRTFETKARLQRPKPLIVNEQTLADPATRKAVMVLFDASLLEVFTQVLKRYAITNQEQIQAMFDHLQIKKAEYFDQCVSSGAIKSPPGYPNSDGTTTPVTQPASAPVPVRAVPTTTVPALPAPGSNQIQIKTPIPAK